MKATILIVIATALCAMACKSTKPLQPAVATAEITMKPTVSPVPRAIIYRTNGNYDENVPITMNGDRIISYPAPSDLTSATPLPLANGYLLDRRGISSNTVFTTYTYPEYSAFSTAPALDALKSAIIPQARVTCIVRLPMTLHDALSDTAAVNRLIRNGLPDCQVVYDAPETPMNR